MNTNTTARASRVRPGRCANCRRPVTTTPAGLVHADNNARHCAWTPARIADPAPTSGPCPDCGRAIGWDGHRYAPCGVAR